ncbi:MmgE/PrpD family protein [Chloroflexota bacterium]
MDLENRIVDFIVNTGFNNLPDEVVAATKLNILDTLCCALGGSGAPGCREVVRLFTGQGGMKSSSVLVYGGKVPPQAAGLVNATMAHALDFDDTHDKAVLHAGVTTVPAALAMDEYLGAVSGKEMITAVALGIDVVCRMGLATKSWIGWILTALYGYFGAATVAGKLLRLDSEGMMNALGIAYAQASGNQQSVIDGALTKRLQPGFAASGGILAALLAREGITGARSVFEGKSGIFNLYGRTDYEPAALVSELGQRFEVTNLSYKPYPCCRIAHSAITAAMSLVGEHNIVTDRIQEVTIEVSKLAYKSLCLPVDIKNKPRNVVDAQFSIPYATAVALATKKVSINDFTEDAIHRPEILELMTQLRCYPDDRITRAAGREISPAKVTVKLTDGKQYSAAVDYPKGHINNPMTREEFDRKLVDCVACAAIPMEKTVPGQLTRLVERLEDVEDIGEISALLSPGQSQL